MSPALRSQQTTTPFQAAWLGILVDWSRTVSQVKVFNQTGVRMGKGLKHLKASQNVEEETA